MDERQRDMQWVRWRKKRVGFVEERNGVGEKM